ncbi:MAG: DEAD/DEAH box helicase family protein [Chloroflexi bacterium]|nr:DEAD/DEAH box helicase family protein [Chloroflexota bacterium]
MSGPLIIQSDHTLMLEVVHPQYEAARDFLVQFAELVKSPEFIHTYRVTPLSLWNAAALDISLAFIEDGLHELAKYNVPAAVLLNIREWYQTYGLLELHPGDGRSENGNLRLIVRDTAVLEKLWRDKSLQPFWLDRDGDTIFVSADWRGNLKQALIQAGYPVKDLCGYVQGDPLFLTLREVDTTGAPFQLRDYQTDAVEAFYRAGRALGGSGIICLPCGSGKTIIGLGAMSRIGAHTLIITTNNISAYQWRDELLAKTKVAPEMIGEYTGLVKEIKPITVTTYQMLTHRRSRNDAFEHLRLFTDYNWGLIIYDEVHMLPAPVFRATVEIQSRRRLGLTATLVREDGREDDVFALIGPKRYDVPWRVLESKGYIAEAYCVEYRVPMSKALAMEYALAQKRAQFRVAAENPDKTPLVQELLENHHGEQVLVIGQYIAQLNKLAQDLQVPLITGKTKHAEREKLYAAFKQGKIKVLVVSKVANFAVDLPDANVMIQVSGTYGSRQEEAQRLGRILRPKEQASHFYTLVSRGTREQEFGVKRQMFLVEQGYRYEIRYAG